MSWKAYPFKDRQIDDKGPQLRSSSFACLFDKLLPSQNPYWANPDLEQPEYSLEDCKAMMKNLNRLPKDPPTGPMYRNAIEAFLRYCIRHECGIRVSF